jgi:hypothetical protein
MILKRLLNTFILCTGGFFFLFSSVDLLTRGPQFFNHFTNVFQILCFYLVSFLNYWNFFASLGVLLSLLTYSYYGSISFEFIALQSSKISIAKIKNVFLLFSFYAVISCLFIDEFILPNLKHKFSSILPSNSSLKTSNNHSIKFEDGSELVFKSSHNEVYHDLFWIHPRKEIWAIKKLEGNKGYFCDHFINENSKLIKQESLLENSFSFPKVSSKLPPDQEPLFSLLREKISFLDTSHLVDCYLLYKTISLALPLFICLMVSPYSLSYDRTKNYLKQAILFLSLLFSLFALTDSLLLLCLHQVISTHFFMIFFFGIFILPFRKFIQMR